MKIYVPYRLGRGPLRMDIPVGNGPYYTATRTVVIDGTDLSNHEWESLQYEWARQGETGIERYWREQEEGERNALSR